MLHVTILLVEILIGLVPAWIAKSKGRDFTARWIYGATLFIVALPHALLIKPNTQRIEQDQPHSDNSRK